MNGWVLDASAVLALFNDEAGGALVAETLERQVCLISSVNIAEVLARLTDRGMVHALAVELLTSLDLTAISFDFASACRCASLRELTRSIPSWP